MRAFIIVYIRMYVYICEYIRRDASIYLHMYEYVYF